MNIISIRNAENTETPSDTIITSTVLRMVALLSKNGNSSFCHVAVHVGTWGPTFSESFSLNSTSNEQMVLLRRDIVDPSEGC